MPYADKTKDKLHSVWRHIKYRCLDVTHYAYQAYGGRGIKVCDEWLNSFMSFYKWAIANGYSDELTIDRIDVNGDYEPSNCRWATAKEQANNRRNNVLLTFNGKTKTMAEWAYDIGITKQALFRRINVYNMPIEIALTAKRGTINRWNRKEYLI